MGEYVLIIMLLGADQRPAIDHIYFADSFACERARQGISHQPRMPAMIVVAECFETKRGKP